MDRRRRRDRHLDPGGAALTDVGFVLLVAVSGLLAGFITTVAGLGGGITLVAILSGFVDPKLVVGLTAPVLMVGNFTRFGMFRAELDRPAAGWFLAGAAPAAVAGAILLPSLPARAVQIGMAFLLLGFVGYTLVKGQMGSVRDDPIVAWTGLPVGVALGALSATVGGAGPIGAPYFHARGLAKGAFAATNAVTNGTVHAIKTVVFLVSGLLTLTALPASAAAAVTVVVGNRAGKAVLGRISETTFVRLLLIAITIAAVRLLVVGD